MLTSARLRSAAQHSHADMQAPLSLYPTINLQAAPCDRQPGTTAPLLPPFMELSPIPFQRTQHGGRLQKCLRQPTKGEICCSNPSMLVDTVARRTSGGSYPYSALKDTDELRLLIIEPGEAWRPVRCSIIHSRLSNRPKYEALSYTWGSDETPQRIECWDGSTIAVTENCFNAVRRLRYANQPRTMWIDAVCIEQANPLERGHQVEMMPRIYSEASSVIVYLGESGDDSDAAMDYLGTHAWINDTPPTSSSLSPSQLALKRLLCRPWFSRLWVLQEVFMAKAVIMFCGDRSVPCHHFQRFAKWTPQDAFGKMPRVLSLGTQRMMVDASPRDFFKLLCETRDCGAKDPRDRIFALLSMASQAMRAALAVDYTVSTETLFTKVASYFIEAIGLDVLCGVDGRSEDSLLPSWVPDLRVPAISTPMIDPNEFYYSAGGAPESRRVEVIESPGGETGRVLLRVRGHRLGRVEAVGDVFETHLHALKNTVRKLRSQTGYGAEDLKLLLTMATEHSGFWTPRDTLQRSREFSPASADIEFPVNSRDDSTRPSQTDDPIDHRLLSRPTPDTTAPGGDIFKKWRETIGRVVLDEVLRGLSVTERSKEKGADLTFDKGSMEEDKFENGRQSELKRILKDIAIAEGLDQDENIVERAIEEVPIKKILRSYLVYSDLLGIIRESIVRERRLANRNAIMAGVVEEITSEERLNTEEETVLWNTIERLNLKENLDRNETLVKEIVRAEALDIKLMLEKVAMVKSIIEETITKENLDREGVSVEDRTARIMREKGFLEKLVVERETRKSMESFVKSRRQREKWARAEERKFEWMLTELEQENFPYRRRKRIYKCCAGRRLFSTGWRKAAGWGPAKTQEGDIVCILDGAKCPFVLRREESHYTLIGACFVVGKMRFGHSEGSESFDIW